MIDITDRSGWGYYSMGLCGYEMKINDSGDSVYWVFIGTERGNKIHKAKIYYTLKGRAYFKAYDKRIHLDECLRCYI